ncbi:MAG: ester cyclase [bacterium]|nr:ester cyclase [bacterium]
MPDNPRTILENFIKEANKGGLDSLDEILHENFINHNPAPGFTPNREGYKKSIKEARTKITAPEPGLPCYQVVIEQAVSEEEVVAARLYADVIHTGSLMGETPTNKQFRLSAFAFFRVESGKIIERWELSDMASQLKKLGASTDE